MGQPASYQNLNLHPGDFCKQPDLNNPMGKLSKNGCLQNSLGVHGFDIWSMLYVFWNINRHITFNTFLLFTYSRWINGYWTIWWCRWCRARPLMTQSEKSSQRNILTLDGWGLPKRYGADARGLAISSNRTIHRDASLQEIFLRCFCTKV